MDANRDQGGNRPQVPPDGYRDSQPADRQTGAAVGPENVAPAQGADFAPPSTPDADTASVQAAGPQGEPVLPASAGAGLFDTGKRFQVHRGYIWLQPLGVAAAVFAALLFSMFSLVSEETAGSDGFLISGFVSFDFPGMAIVLFFAGIAAVFYLVFAVFYAWSYRHIWFQFDEGEFSFYSGIFVKHRVHIPYARVQSVNHRAGILQRVFGLCTATLDTAGGAANNEVVIPYLKLDDAERLRAELFARKAGGSAVSSEYAASAMPVAPEPMAEAMPAAGYPTVPGTSAPASVSNDFDDVASPIIGFRGAFGGAQVGQDEARFETGLSNKELLLASATHSGTVGLLVSFGILALSCMAVLSVLGLLLIPLFLGVVLLAWVVGTVGALLSFGGFKVRRRGSRIEVERGLLQRRFSGIDIARVQSVTVRQGFLRRCLGYCEVSLGRVDSVLDSDAENSGDTEGCLIVHPFIRLDQVDGFLAGLLPEFDDRPPAADLMPLPRVALRRGLIRRCIGYNPAFYCALALAVCQGLFGAFVYPELIGASAADVGNLALAAALSAAFGIGYALCAIITVARVVGAVLWQRESGFGMNRRFVTFRNGGLSTESVTVPRTKVQYGFARTNPLQRMAHTASITMVTAAGRRTGTCVVDVAESDARAWLLWVEPRGSRTGGAASSIIGS